MLDHCTVGSDWPVVNECVAGTKGSYADTAEKESGCPIGNGIGLGDVYPAVPRAVGWAEDMASTGRALGYGGNAGAGAEYVFVYKGASGVRAAFTLGCCVGAGVVKRSLNSGYLLSPPLKSVVYYNLFFK